MNDNKNFMTKDIAKAYCDKCIKKSRGKPLPKGQKYPPGTRVFITNDIPEYMSHFRHGIVGTVENTYNHLFMSVNDPKYNDPDEHFSKQYCIYFDDGHTSSWYHEELLTEIKD